MRDVLLLLVVSSGGEEGSVCFSEVERGDCDFSTDVEDGASEPVVGVGAGREALSCSDAERSRSSATPGTSAFVGAVSVSGTTRAATVSLLGDAEDWADVGLGRSDGFGRSLRSDLRTRGGGAKF